MNRFTYCRPENVEDALQEIVPGARFLGGGTNLIDLMKEEVERPEKLVDVTRLPLEDVVTTLQGGLRVGALVRNSDLAYHPQVETRYPLLAQAILAGASPQLRNMATTGGNLLQRTRCYYFYNLGTACNKREPGTGCAAREGYNRIHAILGASSQCVAVHPSDMCVALAALEAVVHVTGRDGERTIPIADFHRLPGEQPELDSTLQPGELITAVELPAQGFPHNFHYLKLRDRQSFAFALVSVAAALRLEGDRIAEARLAMGGVAHKPWRVPEAEALLVGERPGPECFAAAARRLLEGAQPLKHNAFKLELAQRAVERALERATGG